MAATPALRPAVGSVVRLVRVWGSPIPRASQPWGRVSAAYPDVGEDVVVVLHADGDMVAAFDFWPTADVEVVG